MLRAGNRALAWGAFVFPALLFASPLRASVSPRCCEAVGSPGARLMRGDILRRCQPWDELLDWGHANWSLPRCGHLCAEGYFCSCQMCWAQGDRWPSCAERAEAGWVLQRRPPRPSLLPCFPRSPRRPLVTGVARCVALLRNPCRSPSLLRLPAAPASIQLEVSLLHLRCPRGNSAGETETRWLQRSHTRTVCVSPPTSCHPLHVPHVPAGPVAAVATPAVTAVPRARLP